LTIAYIENNKKYGAPLRNINGCVIAFSIRLLFYTPHNRITGVIQSKIAIFLAVLN